jgi:hypothetical protein
MPDLTPSSTVSGDQNAVADTPEKIRAFMLLSLKGALTLEAKGMKRRGRSALSVIKAEFPQIKARTAAEALPQYLAVLQRLGILPSHVITVTVEGGVIQDVENVPPGVTVRVLDFDTDGAEEEAAVDVNGQPARESLYP